MTEPVRDNPFFVLGVAPDASRIEIEREAQKLLGMLELGFAAAQTYATPLGPRPRTPEAVRAAVAALPPREPRLIGLYYFGEDTMKEIGAEIGVNESRV